MIILQPWLRLSFVAGLCLLVPYAAQASSYSGAYLAARHASADNNAAQAAYYYLKALSFQKKDQTEQNRLREQAVYHLLIAGDVAAATESAKILIQTDPTNRIANLVCLSDDFRTEKFAAAKKRLEQTNHVIANQMMQKLLLAWAEYGIDGVAVASKTLAISNNPQTSNLLENYHLGLIASLGPDSALATKAFSKAITSGVTTPRLAEAFGLFLEKNGKTDQARTLYKQALISNPDEAALLAGLERTSGKGKAPPKLLVQNSTEGAAEVMFDIANILAQNQDYRLSLIYAQLAGAIHPNFPEAFALTGALYESLGLTPDALLAYDKIMPGSPLYVTGQIGRASALSQLDRPSEALTSLQRLQTQYPQNPRVLRAYADMLIHYDKFEQAIPTYDHLISLVKNKDPNQWRVYFNRAVAWHRSNQWAKAEVDLRTALDLDASQASVWNYLGYSLIERHEKLPEAKAMIIRAATLRPTDGYIIDSLGWAHYKLGEYTQAVERLEQAVELNPEEVIINDHLGDAFWKIGHLNEAFFQWRRALSLNPTPEDKTRIEQKIQMSVEQPASDFLSPSIPKLQSSANKKPTDG